VSKKVKVIENNVVLVPPKIDASNKQIFSYNKFRSNADNVLMQTEHDQAVKMSDEIFMPKKFGDFSNPFMGHTYLENENLARLHPDFNLNYLFN
jgi:hypothetical protein